MRGFLLGVAMGLSGITGLAQFTYTESAALLGISHTYGAGVAGGGVSFFDFNQDGWDDLTLCTGLGDTLEFYLNVGGTFQRMDPPPVVHTGRAKQSTWVDFDNDGDYDLLVADYFHGCSLYENTGNLNLVDVTAVAGLGQDSMNTYSIAWGDYNIDGFLDLYVVNSAGDTTAHPNTLYLNNGNGTFTNTTSVASVQDSFGIGLCHAFLDYDKDGLPDLYVSNDKWTPNKLYRNQGDGTFADVGDSANADVILDAMSVTVGDFNHDHWPDIYITNSIFSPEYFDGLSVLLQNNQDGTFTEVADSVNAGFGGVGWSAQWLDADLDMDLDLYVSGDIPGTFLPSSCMHEMTDSGTYIIPPDIGFGEDLVRSYSNAVGDYNNDGYPDICVSNWIDPSHFWANDGGSAHWLKVMLQGTISNRDGIGSWIDYTAAGAQRTLYTHCGEAYLAQNSQYKLLSLDTATVADTIIVTWLSGIKDTVYNVPADQAVVIEEGCGCYKKRVRLDVKVYLEAAWDASGDSMQASLNAILPDTQPYLNLAGYNYAGNEKMDVVFPDVVDWVIVDVLTTDSLEVVARKAGLLTTQGDIVATDGSSLMDLWVSPGTYHLGVRHRNHLDIHTATPVMIDGDTVVVDITPAQLPGNVLTEVGSGLYAMRAGDANGDQRIKYNGASNDKNAILTAVGLLTPNNTVSGYAQCDVNFDGIVKYNGALNDKNQVLDQVGLASPNNLITGQFFGYQ
ncbi:MAG: CRTAC1 family protein [Saprospiraceae bacterium]|nr:CRTAC1 family protein [Saprospiraceae bacterium]